MLGPGITHSTATAVYISMHLLVNRGGMFKNICSMDVVFQTRCSEGSSFHQQGQHQGVILMGMIRGLLKCGGLC